MNKYVEQVIADAMAEQVIADAMAELKTTPKYDKKHQVTGRVVCSVCGYGGGTLKKTDDGYICMSCLKQQKEVK